MINDINTFATGHAPIHLQDINFFIKSHFSPAKNLIKLQNSIV